MLYTRLFILFFFPVYLTGIIGPDTTTNAEAVHKVTSILKIPHIVRKASNAPYLHQLVHESDSYLVEVTSIFDNDIAM